MNAVINPNARNAVGHNDAIYNTFTQEIIAHPNPRDKLKEYRIYLLEFENEAMRLFQAVLAISELLYHLRKTEFILNGYSSIRDNGTNKKTGRNELCPCGSGKKYKYCCGRHI